MAKLSKNGKRLGRPPKNPQPIAVEISAPPEPVESLPKEELVFDEQSMIECQFVKIKEYGNMAETENKGFKDGRYSASNFCVDGFGMNRWVVVGYLKADFVFYKKEQKMQDKEILQRCVNFLNRTTQKKTSKKEAKHKYGKLRLISDSVRYIAKNGEVLINYELSTDQRKNPNFWGEG